MTIENDLTLAGSSIFELDSDTVYDRTWVNTIANVVGRDLTFGGTLSVVDNGVAFADGQIFDLFDWGSNSVASGNFTDVYLPTLSSGLAWKDFGGSQFNYADGSIEVVANAIPEPANMLLLAVGALVIGYPMRRRVSL